MRFPWQQAAWERLPDNDHLAHALIVAGPPGIGKQAFAEELAMRLVCEEGRACGVCRDCRFAASGQHPDILSVAPAPGKSGIPVDSARDLNAFLALTPHLAKRRVALIAPADQLNRSAANALLKTLEEPPGESFLILVTANPGRLLPTIRSRCQRLDLAKPARAAALAYLDAQGVKAAPAALDRARGAPLCAQALTAEALTAPARLLAILEPLCERRLDAVNASEAWQAGDGDDGLVLFAELLAELVALGLARRAPASAERTQRLQALATRLDLRRVYRVWDEILEWRALADAPLDRRAMWDSVFLNFEDARA